MGGVTAERGCGGQSIVGYGMAGNGWNGQRSGLVKNHAVDLAKALQGRAILEQKAAPEQPV